MLNYCYEHVNYSTMNRGYNMKDSLIYEATYRMENVFAEGYIILSDYVEGIFAKDYMAIYEKDSNSIAMSLQTLSFERLVFPLSILVPFYVNYQFSMIGNMLYPGKKHVFFSSNNIDDDLYLNISVDIVQGEEADDILKQLCELRSNFQN